MLFNLGIYAQEKGLKAFIEKRRAKKEAAFEAGKPFLSPLVGPGYTPENGLLLGGGFLYSFKTNKNDSLIQRSSLPINTFISTKGNFGVNTKLASFWLQDRIRFNLEAKFSIANDNYFGVGFSEIESVEQGDSTTSYKRNNYKIAPTFLLRLLSNFYAGIGVDFNGSNVKELNDVMASNSYYNQFGPKNNNAGVRFNLNYDSRDITVNAWKGLFFNFTTGFYGDFLGSDNTYEIYEVDLRSYHQIYREGNLIALKLYGRFGSGEIPYEELTRLGGGKALRGYIEGQYRDRTGVYFLSEWRHTFLNEKGKLSKHGMTAWLGSGSIADNPSEIMEWIPNLGVGYRFEVQPRMNVRIDFGVGKNSSGLYFNFTEAF